MKDTSFTELSQPSSEGCFLFIGMKRTANVYGGSVWGIWNLLIIYKQESWWGSGLSYYFQAVWTRCERYVKAASFTLSDLYIDVYALVKAWRHFYIKNNVGGLSIKGYVEIFIFSFTKKGNFWIIKYLFISKMLWNISQKHLYFHLYFALNVCLCVRL